MPEALGRQGRADLRVVNRPHRPGMAQVVGEERGPMAAQGHPQLGADRAVVAIEIDRRQALVLQPPAADPCLRQR